MEIDSENVYKLSCSMSEHEKDVRAVCVVENQKGTIVCSGSNDASIKLWTISGTPPTTTVLKTLHGHQKSVGTLVTFTQPSNHFPGASFASGGYDFLINIWSIDSNSDSPLLTLFGHEKPVVCLTVTSDGSLVSGSWDHTARIWRGNQCIAVLKSHQQAVWDVLALPNSNIVTASADKTIKIWQGAQESKTLRQHTDVVRALSLTSFGFISCGNDSKICYWDFDGNLLNEVDTASHLLFTISSFPNGNVITGGEDRTVKIWKGSNCIQSITHPSTVWFVKSLINGDIISCCADGIARVWTSYKNRFASQSVLANYQKSIENQQWGSGAIKDKVGNVQMDKLPGTEALKIPGNKIGEIKIIKNGQVPEVYQWTTEESWEKVGDVVDAPSSSKTKWNGKDYDYVFDVDMGDNISRKLPFNNGENPYMAAQEFINREEIDQMFLDEIARFIIKNTGGIEIGTKGSGNVDPYTGNSANNVPKSNLNNSNTNNNNNNNNNLSSPYKCFPQKSFNLFETANFQGIEKKALEFNKILLQNTQTAKVALNDREVELLNSLIQILSETNRYHVSNVTPLHVELVLMKMMNWPDAQRFPAIDLLRIMVLHPEAAKKISDPRLTVLAFSNCLASKTPANLMLALRFISNSFRWQSFHQALAENSEKFIEICAECIDLQNENLRIAAVTVILNYSVLLSNPNNNSLKLQLFSVLLEIVNAEKNERILILALISVGNLCFGDPKNTKVAIDLGLSKQIESFQSSSNVEIQNISKELSQFFKK